MDAASGRSAAAGHASWKGMAGIRFEQGEVLHAQGLEMGAWAMA